MELQQIAQHRYKKDLYVLLAKCLKNQNNTAEKALMGGGLSTAAGEKGRETGPSSTRLGFGPGRRALRRDPHEGFGRRSVGN